MSFLVQLIFGIVVVELVKWLFILFVLWPVKAGYIGLKYLAGLLMQTAELIVRVLVELTCVIFSRLKRADSIGGHI